MSTSTNMSVSGRVPLRSAVRNTVKDFASVARTRVLDSPDVNPNVTNNISNNDLLQWYIDPNLAGPGQFVNVAPADVGVLTAPIAKEIFVSSSGADVNAGASSSNSVLTFQKAVELAGRAQAFDAITIYVKGNVNYNPSDLANRLKESSWGGNLPRGVLIRGLNTTISSPLPANSPPRNLSSQLVPGITFGPNVFSKDPTESLGNVCARYNLNSTPGEIVPFYRDTTGSFHTVAFDTSNNDMFDPTTRRRVYMSDSVALPTTNQDLQPFKFPAKVILNNGGNTTNSGFSMTGNIQFVEVEFALQDGVITPYHINGEFVILYSKFSKTAGSLGATLALSSSGNAADHLSTLRIDPPGVAAPGGKIVKVFKSLFEDLTILFTSPAKVENSVFINCKIVNPQNVTFDGCTFYNSAGVELGDVSEQNSNQSAVDFHNSQFVYGATNQSQFQVGNYANLGLYNVLSRPLSQSGATQNVSLVNTDSNSSLTVKSLKVTSGVNATVSSDNAVVVKAVDSSIDLSDISVTISNSLPIVYTKGSSARIHGWVGDVVSTGPIINAHQSNVLADLTVVDGKYTVAGQEGVLNFDGCNVQFNDFNFNIDGGSTTGKILNILNSTVVNGTSNVFSCKNDVTQTSINVDNSNVKLSHNTADGSISPLTGGLMAKNSTVSIHSLDAKTTWQYTGTTSAILLDNSTLNVTNMAIDTNQPTNGGNAITATSGSKLYFSAVSADFIGLVTDIHLSNSSFEADGGVYDSSSMTIKGEPSIRVTNNSSFKLGSENITSTIVSNANASQPVILVDQNSSCSLINTEVTAASSSRCLEVNNGSILDCRGKSGAPNNIVAAMTSSSADEVILVTRNSKANVSNVELQGNSVGMSQPSGIRVTKLSELYLDTVTGTDINADNGVVLGFNSKLHATNIGDTDLSNNLVVGGLSPVSWFDFKSNRIAPTGTLLVGNLFAGWDIAQGCVATYA